jgi:hypothetical protein
LNKFVPGRSTSVSSDWGSSSSCLSFWLSILSKWLNIKVSVVSSLTLTQLVGQTWWSMYSNWSCFILSSYNVFSLCLSEFTVWLYLTVSEEFLFGKTLVSFRSTSMCSDWSSSSSSLSFCLSILGKWLDLEVSEVFFLSKLVGQTWWSMVSDWSCLVLSSGNVFSLCLSELTVWLDFTVSEEFLLGEGLVGGAWRSMYSDWGSIGSLLSFGLSFFTKWLDITAMGCSLSWDILVSIWLLGKTLVSFRSTSMCSDWGSSSSCLSFWLSIFSKWLDLEVSVVLFLSQLVGQTWRSMVSNWSCLVLSSDNVLSLCLSEFTVWLNCTVSEEFLFSKGLVGSTWRSMNSDWSSLVSSDDLLL